MKKTIREMRKAGAQHLFVEIVAWLRLAGEGATAGEVAKEFGLSRSTARRYLYQMASEGWVEFWSVAYNRSGHKVMWGAGIEHKETGRTGILADDHIKEDGDSSEGEVSVGSVLHGTFGQFNEYQSECVDDIPF